MMWAAKFDHPEAFARWAWATDNAIPHSVVEDSLVVEPPYNGGSQWSYTAYFRGVGGGLFAIPHVPFDHIRAGSRYHKQLWSHLRPSQIQLLVKPDEMAADLAKHRLDWHLEMDEPFYVGVPYYDPAVQYLMRRVQHGPTILPVRDYYFKEQAAMETYLQEIKKWSDETGTASTRRWRLWQLETAAQLGYIEFDVVRKDPETNRDVYYFTSTHPKFKK